MYKHYFNGIRLCKNSNFANVERKQKTEKEIFPMTIKYLKCRANYNIGFDFRPTVQTHSSFINVHCSALSPGMVDIVWYNSCYFS